MTFPERVSVLSRCGYTQRQAEFLVHASLHGGYFMRRHYDRFAGTTSGGPSNRLLAKLRSRGEVKISASGDIRIYHLCSRPFYAKLGEEHNRNRRSKQPRIVRQRLMILDFVLDHLDWRFLPTEQEKLDHFVGLPVPATIYRSRKGAPPTTRYFVDKNPVFLDGEGKPGFAFVDEGMVSPDGFGSWLSQYLALFQALSSFRMIYVAATAAHFPAASRRFQNAIRIFPKIEIPELIQHFKDRDLAARKEFHALGDAGLDRLRKAKQSLSRPQIDELFGVWKTLEPAAFLVRAKQAQTFAIGAEKAFSTALLDHPYPYFRSYQASPKQAGRVFPSDGLCDGSGDAAQEVQIG